MVDPSALDADYAKEFWTLTNIVVGFSIAQTIAVAIAVGPGTSTLAYAVAKNRIKTTVMIVLATAFYVAIVGYCQCASWHLLPKNTSDELFSQIRQWNLVRLIAVAAVGLSGTLLPICLRIRNS